MTITGPDPKSIYPLKDYAKLIFLKNFIKSSNITVGEYTYFDDGRNGPEHFEKYNVLYNNDFSRVKLIIGKFCAIAAETRSGIGIFDFAILLRHRDQFPCDLYALEQGYTAFGGILPDEWVLSALITDFVNIVTLMNASSEQPRLMDRLKNTIQSTIANWDLKGI